MRKSLIVLALIISGCSFCSAKERIKCYSISGNVRSKINKLELGCREIVLSDIYSHERISTISDPSGHFNFQNIKNGSYTIEINNKKYSIAGDSTISIKNKSLKHLRLHVNVDCNTYNENMANDDVTNNQPKLLLSGSIAPVIYKNQDVFEKHYSVKYYDFGCMLIDEDECLIEYDKVIFKYLDKKYGKKWRREVRPDVIGLRKK